MSKEIEARAAQAKADQIAEMEKHEKAGDSFAAYWAASASASLMHHHRRGAVVEVKGGK
jgi:hypothetical protein